MPSISTAKACRGVASLAPLDPASHASSRVSVRTSSSPTSEVRPCGFFAFRLALPVPHLPGTNRAHFGRRFAPWGNRGTDIKVPKKVAITIDAAAAEGFIQNTGKIGRMKHIDLREAWVKDLRDRQHIEFIRKTGPENRADFFTKILTGSQFKAAEDRLMVSLDDQHGLEQLD